MVSPGVPSPTHQPSPLRRSSFLLRVRKVSRLDRRGRLRHIPAHRSPEALARPLSCTTAPGALPIRRPMQAPPVKDGPRINEDIRVPRVLLIDQNGEKQGIMPTSSALEAAEEVGLDLVEIVPNADPPVCKILDYGKFRFQEQKKKNEARKRQKVVE